jgi:hypothetical protein
MELIPVKETLSENGEFIRNPLGLDPGVYLHDNRHLQKNPVRKTLDWILRPAKWRFSRCCWLERSTH